MATIHLLGTGASLSGPDRTTTMLALEHGDSIVLVDCGTDPVQRMLAAGLDPGRIDLLVLTHGHPDHVGGFPLLLQKLWLAKRSRGLPVVGPQHALTVAQQLFACFDTTGWKGLPVPEWHPVEMTGASLAWQNGQWRVAAAPVRHGRTPAIGLRFETSDGSVAAYSGDTEPSSQLTELARGAALLIHEATGGFGGHSSVAGAAGVAREAGAERLVLVHLPPAAESLDLSAARTVFPRLQLGSDGDALDF